MMLACIGQRRQTPPAPWLISSETQVDEPEMSDCEKASAPPTGGDGGVDGCGGAAGGAPGGEKA